MYISSVRSPIARVEINYNYTRPNVSSFVRVNIFHTSYLLPTQGSERKLPTY